MLIKCSILAVFLLQLAASAAAAEVSPFALRNHHPFLHIYGLPAFQSAMLAPRHGFAYRAAVSMVNDAETGELLSESITLDGETYFADFSIRRRVMERLEVGVDLSLESHTGGVFDGVISGWHELLGVPNAKRTGPHNELAYVYEDGDGVRHEVTSASFGLGDVQLTAAVPLLAARPGDSRRVALRLSLKLPTGDVDKLHGSGAADASVALYAQNSGTFSGQRIAYLGFAGVLALGEGEVIAARQRRMVPFGGAAATWQATERFGVTAQLQAQARYIDSELDDLGEGSIQIAFGGSYRLRNPRVSLRFAIVEDLIADTTPDFGLHFAVHVSGGR